MSTRRNKSSLELIEKPLVEINLGVGPTDGRTNMVCAKGQTVFAQGDIADAVFYIQRGKVKLSVSSRQGKEAVIAIQGAGDFFGESCLTGQDLRTSTASAMADSLIVRLEKSIVMRVLIEDQAFPGLFLSYLLARNVRIEEDLVDQLFNSSEKRLARALLRLASFGKESESEPILLGITQETLAEMVGTTRPRISFFLNKFHKLGFVDYNGQRLRVNSSLLTVVLQD